MRESHQIFVIARPKKGQRYRSLASACDMLLCDIPALSICYRLLRIFSDEANRAPIQQELAFAADFFETASKNDIKNVILRHVKSKEKDHKICPFPFITTCLIVGASYKPDTRRRMNVRENPFGTKYNDGRGGFAGTLILDITELSNVRYCFVDIRNMASAQEVPIHTPLDGLTYTRPYHNDIFPIDRRFKDAYALNEYVLVESAALVDCWPKSNWQTTSDTDEQNVGLAKLHSQKTSVRSLRSLCQDKLFPELLSSDGPPDLKLLDKPMLFRGFTRDMQQYLIEHAETLAKSPAAIQILQKAFAGEKSFDFTPFQGKIAADDLDSLANNEALRDVKTLNFSGFDSSRDSKHILSAIHHLGLDNLYLLCRPDRSTDSASQMMTMVMSLAKCSRKPFISQRLVLGSAFSQGLREQSWLPRALEIGPCYWNTFPVIQLLFQGFRKYRPGFHFASGLPPAPEIIENWLADFFLGDALLTPVRFVTGLLTLIKSKFQNPEGPAMTPWEVDVPLMFACAPSSLNTLESSTEVSPIPAEAVSRINDWAQLSVPPARNIHPVGWTAVMIQSPIKETEDDQQPPKTRFQVALVRSKGGPKGESLHLQEAVNNPDRLELVDLKEFLELTAPAHAGDLANCLSELKAWAQTDGELIGKMTAEEAVSALQDFADRPGDWRMGERLVTRSHTKRSTYRVS